MDAFQKSNVILQQVGSMTAYKLSLGQDSTIKTSSMELNFQRSKASNFSNNVAISQGQIQMPNLCEATGAQDSDCRNLVLTTQVYLFILEFFLYSINNKWILSHLDVFYVSCYSRPKR